MENPADIVSKVGTVGGVELWWSGPEGLRERAQWPVLPLVKPSPEFNSEGRKICEVMCTTQSDVVSDNFENLLEKGDYHQTLLECA